jgi:hypothetical protein
MISFDRRELRHYEIGGMTSRDLAKKAFMHANVQIVEVHPRTPAPGEVTLKIRADEGLRGWVASRVRELVPAEVKVHVEHL